MFYISSHTDDGHPTWRPCVARPLDAHAEWVFVREELPHHFLVHNRHQRLPLAVQGGEFATRAQRNLHHLEVIAHHGKGLHFRLTPHCHWRGSVNDDTVAHIVPAERYIAPHWRLHARQRIQTGEQLAAELGLFGGFAVARRRQLQIHRHYV